jgi:transcription termination factor NusB
MRNESLEIVKQILKENNFKIKTALDGVVDVIPATEVKIDKSLTQYAKQKLEGIINKYPELDNIISEIQNGNNDAIIDLENIIIQIEDEFLADSRFSHIDNQLMILYKDYLMFS